MIGNSVLCVSSFFVLQLLLVFYANLNYFPLVLVHLFTIMVFLPISIIIDVEL